AGDEPVEGPRRADPRTDGGLLRPPPGRRGPCRGPAPGAARDEGQVPRAVLLGCLHLPGGSFAPGRGGATNRTSRRLRRLTSPRDESIRVNSEIMDIANAISDHDRSSVRRYRDGLGGALQRCHGLAETLLEIPESERAIARARDGMAPVGADRDRDDRARVPGEGMQELAGTDVPQPNSVVRGSGEGLTIIGR